MTRKSKRQLKYVIGGIVLLVLLFLIASRGGSIPTIGQSLRPQYCDETGCVSKTIFANLPDFPADFNRVKLKIDTGLYSVAEKFSCVEWTADFSECTRYNPDEWYYLQPEFYGNPQTWQNEGYKYYTRPNPAGGFEGITGMGVFPSDTIVSSVRAGDSFEVATYLHSVWFVTKWQGLSLGITYPPSGSTAIGTFEVAQDPAIVKNYFGTEIIGEDTFLFGPTYPAFDANWARRVKIKINVKQNTPPGRYLIALNANAPPEEYERRWFNQLEFAYHSIGGVGISGGLYRVYIEVV